MALPNIAQERVIYFAFNCISHCYFLNSRISPRVKLVKIAIEISGKY